jgi:hypothetical protein
MKAKFIHPSEGTGLHTIYVTTKYTILIKGISTIFIDQISVYIVVKKK